MKIALCGPPHSGKSVLRHRLKHSLSTLRPDIYPYIVSANPDGEGSWFQQAYRNDPALAAVHKTQAKQRWTPAHVDLYASWVRHSTSPLTLIDLGGLIDGTNRQICAAATHAILLAPTFETLSPWRDFCGELGLAVIAELLSDYPATADQILSAGPPFRARVHRLERGDIDSPRPAIDALAEHILSLLAP